MINHGLFLWLISFLFIAISSRPAFSQSINFEDGFEDGTFKSNPTWKGDSDAFIIIDSSPNHVLQLQGKEAGGTSYLSTPSADSIGSWEFYLNLDFSPSGGNKAHIFLMSNIANLEGPVNGYALRAGESGSDDVLRIVRYDNGSEAATVLSGTTDISGGGAYRVKIIRKTGGEWSMEVAEGYNGILVPEGGSQTDAVHSSTNFFGLRTTYTSSRADKFWFDFKIDLPPFTVTHTSALENTIDVTFNRPYDPSTVERSDFTINKTVGQPTALSLKDSVTVRLDYGNPLPSDRYQLTVNNINDRNGNTLPTNTVQRFIIFGTHNSGDITLNEFAYDPPSSFDEYIEIKNTSAKYLNLKNWTIADRTSTATFSTDRIVIEPDSFLVVSPDTTALYSTFGAAAYHYMSSFPTLNNGGDRIVLTTPDGKTADSVSYSPEWEGNSFALERRSVEAPSQFQENWANSPAPNRGTPGRANQVAQDKEPPAIAKHSLLTNAKIELVFSERLNQANATDLTNYNFMPNRKIQLISSSVDTVTLYLTKPLASETSYSLSVSDMQDIFGNKSAELNRQIEYVAFKAAKPGDIVINELMINPDADTPEFIELYNRSDKNIKLSGWTLGDGTDKTNIDQSISLRANQYLVLTGSASFAQSNAKAINIPGFPNLNNTEDAVFLSNSSNTRIDSLYYRSNWTLGPDSYSMERQDPYAASNDSSNWKGHSTNRTHSAGQKNDSYQKDKTKPDVLFAHLRPDKQIEIIFNEFIHPNKELLFSLNGTTLPMANFEPTKGNKVILQQPATGLKEHLLAIQNLVDIRGNKTTRTETAVALPIRHGDLVINEIMFSPINDNDDNKPDQSEYVELYNTRNYALSLEGLVLHDAKDEDGEVRELRPVSTTAKWVKPHETVLIHADETSYFNQSRVATFFELQPDATQDIIQIDRTGLSLGSTEDAIYLADSTGTVIDSIHYNEKWHNPNLIDKNGIALERINPNGPSNTPSNWSSSVAIKGGTPKGQNSIYQEQPKQRQDVGISFSPNPFSPDGDGHEDNLIISYKLDQPDYLLRVNIFDRYGRHINELADGKAAGFEGQLIWDGRREDGQRNRIGIYIIVFEAIDSASGKDKAFKKTVVIARRLN